MFLLYGATPLEQAEVDHWLEYSVSRMGPQQTSGSGAASLDLLLSKLDAILASRTYLVGYGATMADFAVYGALCGTCVQECKIRFLLVGQFGTSIIRI